MSKNFTTHISADSAPALSFKELRRYQELLYFFIWREYKVRYKQTYLGILWTVMQPVLFAGLVGVILLRRGGISFDYADTSGIIVVLIGFILWTLFEQSFSGSAGSLTSNKGLMNKIYFPRILPIVSTVISRLIDLVFSLVVFFLMAWAFGAPIHWQGVVAVIPLALFLSLSAFGVGLVFAMLSLRYRDIDFLKPFLTRMLFFSSPIWYPFEILPDALQKLFYFNPIVGAIESARALLFDPARFDVNFLLLSSITTVLVLWLGLIYFKKQQKNIVDLL